MKKNRGKKGYRPVLCFIDETREYLLGKLRKGETISGEEAATSFQPKLCASVIRSSSASMSGFSFICSFPPASLFTGRTQRPPRNIVVQATAKYPLWIMLLTTRALAYVQSQRTVSTNSFFAACVQNSSIPQYVGKTVSKYLRSC